MARNNLSHTCELRTKLIERWSVGGNYFTFYFRTKRSCASGRIHVRCTLIDVHQLGLQYLCIASHYLLHHTTATCRAVRRHGGGAYCALAVVCLGVIGIVSKSVEHHNTRRTPVGSRWGVTTLGYSWHALRQPVKAETSGRATGALLVRAIPV